MSAPARNRPVSLRKRAIEAHPRFPWLSVGDVAAAQSLAERMKWLRPGERVESLEKAGEGNMNLTLRLRTAGRTMVLKQARPWVEKYDFIAAPWDRILFEQRFYRRAMALPEVAPMMPRLLGADADAKVLLIEDIPGARDFTSLYSGDRISSDELVRLGWWLHSLHASTRGEASEDFANAEMRALNHAHIFHLPLTDDLDLELDEFEQGLQSVADRLKSDADYVRRVRETGDRYLASPVSVESACLLHGDYFPGSWLRSSSTPAGLYVIDPEFCFFGDPEWDAAVTVAHLALAKLPLSLARDFLLAAFPESDFDAALLARYAACEVMRRLIGVAQLPLPPAHGRRAALLEASRATLLDENMERLWQA